MYSKIFEPLQIKNKTFPNRLFAQAMEGNDGENGGLPSERTINRYVQLAEGKWGAVLVEAVSITETSLARVNGMIINKKNLDGIKRLVETFKTHNCEGLLLLQITHSGERSGPFSDITTLTPSNKSGPRYIPADEIARIRDRFIEGARLAEEAGVDGIDFKMCHGYFGGEMLRPSNTRDDQWGGTFENRTRFLQESVEGIKAGRKDGNFILGSRLSMYEGIRGGCGTSGPDEIVEDLSQMLDVVRLMDELGMDYVNVSAGIPALTGAITRPTEPSKYLALHQLRYAKTVKDMVKKENRRLKVIGSAYSAHKAESLAVAEEMLSKDNVDLCGFGRQIFADPLTPKKIAAGETVNWCILCSGCSKLMAAQLNDGCIVYNDYYKEVNRNHK
ncbi:NADH:flavin oxidoreductase [Spirochaetia bacterium]|nr:NADH:flavin oxidoreductase [Spirochaetia bacterium]